MFSMTGPVVSSSRGGNTILKVKSTQKFAISLEIAVSSVSPISFGGLSSLFHHFLSRSYPYWNPARLG